MTAATCRNCGPLPITEFYMSNGYPRKECKRCRNASQREDRQSDEKVLREVCKKLLARIADLEAGIAEKNKTIFALREIVDKRIGRNALREAIETEMK